MSKVKRLVDLPEQERAHYDRCRMRRHSLEAELAPWKGEIVLFEATMPAEDGENVHQGWRTVAQTLAELDKWRGWNLRLKLLPHGNSIAVPINPDELRGIQARTNAIKEKIANLNHVMSSIIKL